QGPANWTVTATPSGAANAAQAVVPAGQSGSVTVAAVSPDDATADSYPITLTATGGPQPLSIDLAVQITGSFALTVAPQDGRLNASAQVGTDTPLNLNVTNTGTAPLDLVNLTSTPPSGWTVTFSPTKLTNLAPNVATPVVATLHPSAQ